MELLKVAGVAFGSVVALFILTKIMGNRQMSQLSMFDYIIGITIGSIAAEMAISLKEDFRIPLVAMVVYAVVAVAISFVTAKSVALRRVLVGKALIVLEDGKIFEGNLKKGHLDLNEFLTQCRNSGYFDLQDIQSAILEANGKISFLPKSEKRPTIPEDFNQSPKEIKPLINLIIDGKIMKDNLEYIGKDEKWLENHLKNEKIDKLSQVFLATYDAQKKLTFYSKNEKTMTRDIFE